MRRLFTKITKTLSFTLSLGYCITLAPVINAQSVVSFTSSNLIGENLNKPTTLDFGPDNRLYVAQQDGTIYAYTIQKNAPNSYQVTNTETILLVKQIPNHNDNGALNTGVTSRQITGILATGTASNPVLYVGSSDPRIGGGGSGGDLNLDTNSGIISRLTKNGNSWTKVDIVIGLPRSEENHANNGMVLDEVNNILYVAQGGNTNAGAPSNNFAFLTEYALSAAILKIDLTRIQNEFSGSYTLPTLDDPTRTNVSPGVDENDPFGGNDGLNQAKLVPSGPVQIHSPGYRNIYDLVITKTPGISGRMYTIDNGPNGGWGGHPDNEGIFGNPIQTNVTNNYVIGEPGSNGPGPNDAKVNNRDGLHFVSGPGVAPKYGGHPTPIRANPQNAGLYWYNNATGTAHFELSPTVDWPPVPLSMANPVEGDFRNPGVDDGALYTWGASTNGLTEYTSSLYFDGQMQGNLLAASFDGNIYRIQLDANGTSVTNVSSLFSGFGSTPLDVIAQGSGKIFEGTVWVATYGSSNITIFEPVGPALQTWEYANYANGTSPQSRHENGFIQLNGKFYLIGGRGTKTVGIYDPVARIWTSGAAPPLQLHHFQAVAYQSKIYIICAFTGSFPNETPVDKIYIFDPSLNTWSDGPIIPVGRRRGSAGVALYKNKFYIAGGIQNGHVDGWVKWMDVFDPSTGQWTQLPDSPEARDHFHAGLIGGKMYLAGGRRTGESGVFGATVSKVDVYDIDNNTWSSPTQIPTPRGAPGVTVLSNHLIVAGGEVAGQSSALTIVESYDPASNAWVTKPPMNVGRHGTQLISHGGRLYMPAGSTTQGGAGETNTMSFSVYSFGCTGDNDSYELDDDGDGYSNADERDNGTDPCSAASRPPDFDNDFISDLNDPDDDNDGINDILDLFAWDASNGLNTNIRVDYPLLNGDPGFGFFGLGFTGLMTNKINNYADNYPDHPDMIMGGAVGAVSVPAGPGDALTNNQKYALQFGVKINQSTGPFTVQSRILGSPFFDGVSAAQLGNQAQGVYFGNGDQDNYFKLVLHGNTGNPGFQLLSEINGNVAFQQIVPVSNILSADHIDLFIDINPSTGVVSCRYKTNTNASPVAIGNSFTATGNLLNVLQNNQAVAVGIIASSGMPSTFSATWDDIKVTNSSPYVIAAYPKQVVPPGQSSLTVPLDQIFGYDKGIQNLVFSVTSISNPTLISSTEIDNAELKVNFASAIGTTSVSVRASSQNDGFAESSFEIELAPDVVQIVNINSGGSAQQFGNQSWVSDQYFTGGSTYSNSAAISGTDMPPVYQSERFGNFTYKIPATNGLYALDIHLAEIYWGVVNTSSPAEKRVFNVNVENGQFILQNLDIAKQYGSANAVVIRTTDFQVSDVFIDITFSTVKDNAKVSGISVYKYSSGVPPPAVDNPPFVIAPYPNQIIPVNITSLTVPLEQIFNDDKGVANLSFQVVNTPNPALVTATQIIGTQLQVSFSGQTGTTSLSLRATDQNNAFVESSFFIERVPEPVTPDVVGIININSGGPSQQFGSDVWSNDQYFSGGSTYTKTIAINNTSNDAIYQTERFGNFSYSIPVPSSGLYYVDIHLAEIYWGVATSTGVNKRIFNIGVENSQFVLQNLDIVSNYGVATAGVIRADNILVNDGFLNITFTTVKDNAKVSGISVFKYSSQAPTSYYNAPYVTQPPDKVLNEGEHWNYQILASARTPGDALTFSAENLPASLYIDPTTGLISGTIEVSPGVFPVAITASAPDGASTTIVFTITILESTEENSHVISPPAPVGKSLEFATVYPNPTSNDLSLRVKTFQSNRWNFVLYNAIGEQVNLGSRDLAAGIQELDFDLRPYLLSGGIYYISIQNNQSEKTILKVAIIK